MLKYVIAGAPRGATHYISYLLTACQLYCGHEAVLDFNSNSEIVVRENDWLGDATYISAPFNDKNVVKVHWVRDPVKTISSLVSKGWLQDESLPFVGFVASYAPGFLEEKDPISRAARFYADWNALACSGSSIHWSDDSIHSSSIRELGRAVGARLPVNLGDIISRMPRNISPRMESEPVIMVKWEDIPVDISKDIKYYCK